MTGHQEARSSELVTHLARLARLGLTPEQVARYPQEFRAVVDYVGQVERVRADPHPLTATISGVRHVLREDRAEPSILANELLRSVPQTEGRSVRVPPVL